MLRRMMSSGTVTTVFPAGAIPALRFERTAVGVSDFKAPPTHNVSHAFGRALIHTKKGDV
jgi:hypothetical protein